MSSLDYLELCRLCLVKENVELPIFEDDGEARQIFFKISACLPVKVARDDKLPKKICDQCGYKVELLYQFWNTTVNAEKQLLQWLGEVGGLEDKQGYITEVLDSNVMKQERGSDSRLDGSVMQVAESSNIDINMIDNMSIITMPDGSEQQFTTVPIEGSTTVQVVAGSSTQEQANVGEEEEEEEEDNFDDGCDNDDGMTVKEETEDDQNERSLESTFVNVSMPCDEAGPSGLQQKITNMSEITPQTADGDSKPGKIKRWSKKHDILSRVNVRRASELYANSPDKEITLDKSKILGKLGLKRKSSEPLEMSTKASTNKKRAVSTSKPPPNKKSKPTPAKKSTPVSTRKSKITPAKKSKTISSNSSKKSKSTPTVKPKPSTAKKSVTKKSEPASNKNKNSKSSPKDKKTKEKSSNSTGNKSLSKMLEPNTIITARSGTVQLSGGVPWRKLDSGHFACNVCRQVFVLYQQVKRHIATWHFPPALYHCDYCGKIYKSKYLLSEHINSHRENSSDYLWCCDKCDYRAKSKYYLKVHLVRKHTDEAPFECDICKKRFKVKNDIKFHLGTHSDSQHMCDICGRMYTSKDSLVKHRRVVHVNTYNYRCPICNQKLLTEKALDEHVKKHKDQYSCDECDLKFTKKYYVTRHKKRVHRVEKTIECHICNKTFVCMSTYRIHYLTHAKVKPYLCNVCGYSFTQRSSMMLHWKKKHPDAGKPPPPVMLTNIFGDIESKVNELQENNEVHIPKRKTRRSNAPAHDTVTPANDIVTPANDAPADDNIATAQSTPPTTSVMPSDYAPTNANVTSIAYPLTIANVTAASYTPTISNVTAANYTQPNANVPQADFTPTNVIATPAIYATSNDDAVPTAYANTQTQPNANVTPANYASANVRPTNYSPVFHTFFY